MKQIILTTLILIMAAGLLIANGQQDTVAYGRGLRDGSGRGAGTGMGPGNGSGRGYAAAGSGYGQDVRFTDQLKPILLDAAGGDLSQAEVEMLGYMLEEEKLARDVYSELYSVWNLPVFGNIAESEQQHMDSVGILLERYDLERSGMDLEPGSFSRPELQTLYDSLVSEGRESLVAALTAGAVIEDLDISDLQKGIAESDNDDIRILYQNLMKGSRNHMRSFNRQLEREGETYEARYITDEYLAKILHINQEIAPITDPNYGF